MIVLWFSLLSSSLNQQKYLKHKIQKYSCSNNSRTLYALVQFLTKLFEMCCNIKTSQLTKCAKLMCKFNDSKTVSSQCTLHTTRIFSFNLSQVQLSEDISKISINLIDKVKPCSQISDPRFHQDLHQFAELQFCSPACKFHPLMCKNLKFLFAVSRGPGLITGCCVRADKSDIDSYEPHCLPRHQEPVNNIIQENNHSNTASNKLS